MVACSKYVAFKGYGLHHAQPNNSLVGVNMRLDYTSFNGDVKLSSDGGVTGCSAAYSPCLLCPLLPVAWDCSDTRLLCVVQSAARWWAWKRSTSLLRRARPVRTALSPSSSYLQLLTHAPSLLLVPTPGHSSRPYYRFCWIPTAANACTMDEGCDLFHLLSPHTPVVVYHTSFLLFFPSR